MSEDEVTVKVGDEVELRLLPHGVPEHHSGEPGPHLSAGLRGTVTATHGATTEVHWRTQPAELDAEVPTDLLVRWVS